MDFQVEGIGKFSVEVLGEARMEPEGAPGGLERELLQKAAGVPQPQKCVCQMLRRQRAGPCFTMSPCQYPQMTGHYTAKQTILG